MNKVIGIVPPAKLFEDEIPHHDLFLFANPYVKKLVEQGATPLGILSPDGHALEEALGLCGAFLLAGGTKIWPYHLQVIEHAIAARKPVLGICLGMQAIAAYFQVLERGKALGEPADTPRLFAAMKKERFMFTFPIAGHFPGNVTRAGAQHARHPITVKPGSRLYEAIGKTQMESISLHSYQVAPPAGPLKISALAYDGSIEGLEYEGFIVGVQFHPEVEETWDKLFAAFVHGNWADPVKPPAARP